MTVVTDLLSDWNSKMYKFNFRLLLSITSPKAFFVSTPDKVQLKCCYLNLIFLFYSVFWMCSIFLMYLSNFINSVQQSLFLNGKLDVGIGDIVLFSKCPEEGSLNAVWSMYCSGAGKKRTFCYKQEIFTTRGPNQAGHKEVKQKKVFIKWKKQQKMWQKTR